MIGDFLFELSARDEQVTPLEIIGQQISSASAAAVQTVNFDIPIARAFHFTHFQIRATPGAGQNVTNYFVQALRSAAETRELFIRVDQAGAAANVVLTFERHVDIWLQPGARLQTVMNFNAGVASNELQMTVFGILIPRGNFAV